MPLGSGSILEAPQVLSWGDRPVLLAGMALPLIILLSPDSYTPAVKWLLFFGITLESNPDKHLPFLIYYETHRIMDAPAQAQAGDASATAAAQKAAQEAARLARIEAERKAKEEAARKAQEKAEREAREEAARKEKEQQKMQGGASQGTESAGAVENKQSSEKKENNSKTSAALAGSADSPATEEQERNTPVSTADQYLPPVSISEISESAGKERDSGADAPGTGGKIDFKEVQNNAPELPSTRQAPTENTASLSKAQLDAVTETVHDQLGQNQWFIDLRGGDAKGLSNTLSQYSPEQRRNIKAAYDDKYGQGKFEENLQKELSKNDREDIKLLLNTSSNGPNLEYFDLKQERLEKSTEKSKFKYDALDLVETTVTLGSADLRKAYGRSEAGKESTAHQRDLLQQVSILDSNQIEELDRQSRLRDGISFQDRLLNDPNLTAANKNALDIFLKGADKINTEDRTQLASLAVDSGNLDLLESALKNSPEAREQLRQTGFGKELEGSFEGKELDIARDILNYGDETLSTQIDQSRQKFLGFLWDTGADKETVETAVSGMDQEERDLYTLGQKASRSQEPSSLSADERKAFEYYMQVNESIDKNFSDRDALTLKSSITQGEDSLVNSIRETRNDGIVFGLGAGNRDAEVSGLIENISEDQFNRLREDPSYYRQTKEAINLSTGKDNAETIIDLLDRKLSRDNPEHSYSQSQSEKLALLDNISINGTRSGSERTLSIVNSVSKISEAELERYKSDPEYKESLDKALRKSIGGGTAFEVSQSILERGVNGEDLAITAVEQVKLGSATGASMETTVTNIENAFASDPALKARLQNPQSDADRELKRSFDRAIYSSASLDSSVTTAEPEEQDRARQRVFDHYAKMLYSEEGVPLEEKLSLASSKEAKYELVLGAPQEVKERLFESNPDKETLEYQNRILRGFSKEEREVLSNITTPEQQEASGEKTETSQEDRLRLLIVNSETRPEEFKNALNGLSNEQLTGLKDSYSKRYDSDLGTDILNRIPDGKKQEFLQLLKGYDQSDAESLAELQSQRQENESGFLGNVEYGSRFTAIDAQNDFLSEAQLASSKFEDVPEAERKLLVANATTALSNWSEDRSETANTATDGVIIVGALTATVASGGTASPLLIAAVGGGGALTKVAGNQLLLGDQYESSDAKTVIGDATHGFVLAAGSMIGPEHLAGVFKVGNNLGTKMTASVVSEMVEQSGKSLLKEGGEEVLEQSLQKAFREAISKGSSSISDDVVKNMASQVALPGSQEGVEQAIKAALIKSNPRPVTQLFTEVGLNASAGSLADSTGAALKGVVNWDGNLSVQENLGNITQASSRAALEGFFFSGVGTVGLKSIGLGWDNVFAGRFNNSIKVPISFADDLDNGYRQKLSNFKHEIGISPSDPVSVQRRKLLEHFTSEAREPGIKLNIGDQGIKVEGGDVGLRYAQKLGIPEDLIPVKDLSNDRLSSLAHMKGDWLTDNRLSSDALYQVTLRQNKPVEVLNDTGKIRLQEGEELTFMQRTKVKPEYEHLAPVKLKQRFEEVGIIQNGDLSHSRYLDLATENESRLFINTRANANTSVFTPVEQFSENHHLKPKAPIVNATDGGDLSLPTTGGNTGILPELELVEELYNPNMAAPVTPEALRQDLVDLPDGGAKIKRIVVDDRAAFGDQYNSVKYFDEQNGLPFYAAMDANSYDGEMNIYPGSSNQFGYSRRENIRHEWSHFQEPASNYRSDYDAAIKLESTLETDANKVLLRPYAGYNESENWAVHLGEGYMADSDQTFIEKILDPATGKTAQLKELLHAKALEEALLEGKANGHMAPRYEELMRRSKMAQARFEPGAKNQLRDILSDSNYDEETQNLALKLFKPVYGEDTAEKLLELDPAKIHNTKNYMNALERAHGFTVPEEKLIAWVEEDGILSGEALLVLTHANDFKYPNRRGIIEKNALNGNYGKLQADSGDSDFGRVLADYLGSDLDSSSGRMRIAEINLDAAAGNPEAQANLFKSLLDEASYSFEDDEMVQLIEWGGKNMHRSETIEKELRIISAWRSPFRETADRYLYPN